MKPEMLWAFLVSQAQTWGEHMEKKEVRKGGRQGGRKGDKIILYFGFEEFCENMEDIITHLGEFLVTKRNKYFSCGGTLSPVGEARNFLSTGPFLLFVYYS